MAPAARYAAGCNLDVATKAKPGFCKKDRLKTRAGRLHCLYYCVVLGVLAESELLLFTSRKARHSYGYG